MLRSLLGIAADKPALPPGVCIGGVLTPRLGIWGDRAPFSECFEVRRPRPSACSLA